MFKQISKVFSKKKKAKINEKQKQTSKNEIANFE